jgi:hypothetical protein
MNKWKEFFNTFFNSSDEAQAFIEPLEALNVEDRMHPAKIMMHQTQRLISIADDIPTIRSGKESLQLLFLLICAENIAKLHYNFDEDGQSKAFVVKFFKHFIKGNDKDILETSFTTYDMNPLALEGIATTLYSVRCGVVHEGKYWDFHFRDNETQMLNIEPDVIVSITLNELRCIIVRGCICAIKTYPGRPELGRYVSDST